MKNKDTNNTIQAAWVGIGSLSSFLFTVASSAILSRYLTKDNYGTYKQVMYIYHTLLLVFTLGLPLAYSYFLPKVSLGEGKTLVDKLNFAFLILGGFFSIVLYLGADVCGDILKNPTLGNNIRIFSPAPMLILPTMGLNGIMATYRMTMWNAIYLITTRILMLLCVAIPVIFINSNCETAIWGFLISSFISCIIALVFKRIPFRGISRSTCDITYKDIFKYTIPLMAAGLFGIGIKAADQFYVSRYFGQEIFADFANGSLELPFVGMILSAGAAVLLPTFSKMISNGNCTDNIVNLWKRSAIKSSMLLYPLAFFSWFFASEIMVFLYGEKYALSSIYFRIMLCVNLFTVAHYYPIILALGKTKDYARVHMINFLMVWAFEFIAIQIIDSAYAITVVSAVCRIIKILMFF